SNSFSVNPAALDHFSVTDTSGAAIGTQTAGGSFNVKVRAFDTYGNLEDSGPNAFNGTVDVSSTRTCSAGCVQSAAFTNGVLASHAVTLTQSGLAEIDVVKLHSFPARRPSDLSNSFTVNPAATHD